MSSTWLSVVLVCFLGFFFSPVNVSAGFIADCQQAEIDGLFLTMTPGVTSVDQTVNFGLANATGTAFQLFTHPNATQRQLLSYSAPLFLVNQIRLSQTITDHNIEILTIPFNENIPGVTPFISISLNGVFLRAQDGGIQFPVPANSPIPFRFIGQFLGDGTVDTPNLVMINITSFGSNGQGAGYNTCAFFYLFNITNPSNRSVILGDPQVKQIPINHPAIHPSDRIGSDRIYGIHYLLILMIQLVHWLAGSRLFSCVCLRVVRRSPRSKLPSTRH